MSDFSLTLSGMYFKKDCGICGNLRLCYAIAEHGVIHGFICRRCRDFVQLNR